MRFNLQSGLTTGLLLLFAAFPVIAGAAESKTASEQLEFFEKKVRPILVDRCYTCHSADTKPAGGLRVDDRNGLLVGGNNGPAAVPGDPDGSLLIQRVTQSDAKKRMPRESDPLSEEQIAILKTWISQGVAWPAEDLPAPNPYTGPLYEKLRKEHWSFRPLSDPEQPAVKDAAWPAGGIDRFILAKLEEHKLTPVADADRATLIRRLTFDLTGLPPTPGEIDAFVNDRSKDAYPRLVDRLLQSPRFGERWGRHWLDVARYAESTGPSRNVPYPHAWKYRDYVIDAVNRDIPFNRFIQEQVAGDLLPAETLTDRDRLLIATGFLALGTKDVNQRFKERFMMDNVDEQIDTISRSVLGLTVSCARCHDHKFDPIPTTDYYALAGIFTSTENAAGVRSQMGGAGFDYYEPKMLVNLVSDKPPEIPEEQIAPLRTAAEEAKKQLKEISGTPEGLEIGPDGRPKQRVYRLRFDRLQAELLALTDPATRGYAVHGVREGQRIGDTSVRIRGQAERLGPTVPRGFLTAFAVPETPQIDGSQSGRLQLAEWLTNPKNPLTTRVIVNRVWQHLFGQGIVTTVDNFGFTGDRPVQPELLDHLANEFIRGGWSVKSLVREIVLSHAYRLGSEAPAAYRDVDPENRFFWRHAPRRLEAEEMRDAILATSGRLDLQPPQGSPTSDLRMIEMRDDGPEAKSINEKADASVVRSVYLPLLRGVTPRALAAFDPVTQTLVTGQRDSTTVPTQALFLINSSFVRRQSLALAQRLLADSDTPLDEQIRQAYRLTLGREPNQKELDRDRNFLSEYEVSYRKQPPPALSTEEAVPPAPADLPVDQDDERQSVVVIEEQITAPDSRQAAWMSFAQALYASAEFRFVR